MTPLIALVLANIILALLDIYSTQHILRQGGRERVWLARTLMARLGMEKGILVTKLLMGGAIYLVYLVVPQGFEWSLAVAALIQAGFVVNNLLVIQKLK